MPRTDNLAFFKDKTTTGMSEKVDIRANDILALSVHGSGTFTLQFLASHDTVNYFPVEGTCSGAATTMASSTSTFDTGWEFDVTNFASFKVNLSALSGAGAKVTVVGSLINVDY